MTAPAVGLISNPGSGHNREQFPRIRAQIEGCPAIHHVVTRSAEQIGTALAELAARDIAVLAINGGDGTCSAILGAMLESGLFADPPLIALLPGGTANMNAGDIGIRGSLAKATAQFCHWCERGHGAGDSRVARALMRVVTDAEQPPRYGMFLGAGAVIQGTDYAHREIHSRGLRDDFSLALGTVRTVWGLIRDDPAFNRHVAVRLALDGAPPRDHDTLILAMSTLQRLAFGMRPFWGEGEGDIRLTLIEQHCTRFGRTFLSIVRGHPSRHATAANGYHSDNARKVALDLEGKLNLDGEILLASGPVEITASRRLEFLRL